MELLILLIGMILGIGVALYLFVPKRLDKEN